MKLCISVGVLRISDNQYQIFPTTTTTLVHKQTNRQTKNKDACENNLLGGGNNCSQRTGKSKPLFTHSANTY